jgi:hypothetical protein
MFSQTYSCTSDEKRFWDQQLIGSDTLLFFVFEIISSHILIKRTSMTGRLSTSFVDELFSVTFVLCHSKNTTKKHLYTLG